MSKRLTQYRPAWLTWVTLAVGLALTALATVATHSVVVALNRAGLETIGAEIAHKVETRLHAYALVLRDAAAFLQVSGEIDRTHWRDYVAQAKVHLNLPGVQGLGFALLIPPDRLTAHVRTVRDEGFPDYRVWPEGERPVYTSIIFLEPFAGRNLRAFGYDMFAEPVRRAAMERARDQDVAALSDKVRLVQETETDIQAGTLMYVPAYRPGVPTETVDRRRAALRGWVYSPYRMDDLMHGILGTWDRDGGKRIRLALYDADGSTPEALLYDSQAADRQRPAPASANAVRIPIDFNGQRWTLDFSQAGPPGLLLGDVRVMLVAGSGVTISVLLAALVGGLVRTRLHARQLAAEFAARERAEHQYREIFETSPAGIYRSTAQGRYLDVNPACARILGYESPQALIAGISDIGTQVYANPRDREVFARTLAEHGAIQAYEVELQRRDGEPVWVSASATAERDAAGRIVTYRGVMTDITERVRAMLVRDTVGEVARLAVASDSADGFRQALPALLSTRLDYPMVAVETYDATGAAMVFAGSVGTPGAAGPLRVPVGETLSGQVATSGKALVETAADARPEYAFAALRALGVVTFVCVPMALGTRVLGTLALADTRRRRDAAWVVELLQTVADSAADAIGRLETQAALRDSERNFRSLVDNLHAGVVVHGPDTRIRLSNPMASQLLGLSVQQIQDLAAVDPAWRFIREDGTPMPPEEYPITRVKASGAPLDNLILGIRAPDRDSPRWVQCEAHPTRDDQGQIQQIVVTFFDVTERVRAERALQESQEWLQLAMENSRSFAFEWHPQSDRVRRSPTCVAILGLSGEAAEHDTGQGFFQRVVPDDRMHLRALLESLRPDAPRYHAEYRVTRGDGGTVVLEEAAQGFFDAHGRLQRLVGATTDITERHLAVEALQKNRDVLNAMGRMAGVGGWEFNVVTGRAIWTEAIYDIHELAQGEMPTVEQGIAFYSPESRPIIAEAVRRAIDLGQPYDLELEMVTAKGRRRWVHTIGQAIREDSRTIAVSGTFQDITERKQTELELDRHRHQLEVLVEARTQALNEQLARVREQEHLLIHQARLAAMGEMLGNIAHQWRQPLSALALVLGNLQDAERFQELSPQYLARQIADAYRLIDKMSSTISDFRDFFRPDKPPETFDVSQPVGAALTLMDASLKAHGIAVVTDFCAEARTTGALNEYSQVILNLLGNAKDAILAHHPDGGQIVVRVDRDGDQARVRVIDDGGGIAEAARERLFEPYFSTKADGTGIGLYMSKMIVEKGMGGRLSACNRDAGAEFTVLTPLARQEQ